MFCRGCFCHFSQALALPAVLALASSASCSLSSSPCTVSHCTVAQPSWLQLCPVRAGLLICSQIVQITIGHRQARCTAHAPQVARTSNCTSSSHMQHPDATWGSMLLLLQHHHLFDR